MISDLLQISQQQYDLDWEPKPSGTEHGNVAEQSEDKRILAYSWPADVIRFHMGDAPLGSNKHAYRLVFYMYAKTHGGGEIVLMRMKVDGVWYNDYAGVDEGYEWCSFQEDGWWDDGDIDDMLTGIETQFGDWNHVSVSRVKVKVYWTDAPI